MLENRRWINQYVSLSNSLPEYLLSCRERTPSQDEISTFQKLIASDKKLYVELGSGSGQHILSLAEMNPNSFYVGFELRYKRAFKTAEKAKLRALKNIFIIRDDITNIAQFIQPKSVSGIYINFPDPWDRKKWKKHRMLSETTLPVFHSLLVDNGSIRFKTDHPGYFKDSLELVSQGSFFTTIKSTEDLHSSEYCNGNVLTEFEQLFLSKKMPIYFAEFAKHSGCE